VHDGPLSLDGLRTLSDEAAQALGSHKGDLSLNSLTALTDGAAEALVRHRDDISQRLVNGFTKAAMALIGHGLVKTTIDLDSLCSVNRPMMAVEAPNWHSGAGNGRNLRRETERDDTTEIRFRSHHDETPTIFTKSRFKVGMECPAKLFYTRKDAQYANEKLEDSFLAALAEGAFKWGLAKAYFPGGQEVKTPIGDAALAQTNELLRNDDVSSTRLPSGEETYSSGPTFGQEGGHLGDHRGQAKSN